MENEPSKEELMEMARQLAHPQGENGIKIAARLAENNKGMVQNTIDALDLGENEVVLEIGQADAPHLSYFLEKAPYLVYFGVDVSKEMTDLAKLKYHGLSAKNQAYFYWVDGCVLPFPSLRFDKVFTVNTIYFWQNPDNYLLEIKRVLRPGGIFAVAFADKDFMQALPFVQFGFTLYPIDEMEDLLSNNGFELVATTKKAEQVQVGSNEFVARNYWVITARA